MNTAREEQFWLTVRVGECGRRTETDGKISQRRIELRKCPILSNNLKGENQPARGDEIDLSIYEWSTYDAAASAQAIGFIGSIQVFAFIELSLPPATFAEFWAASAAADCATRDVTIRFKNAETSYSITKVELIEHMPEAINLNPKAHALIRVHPVVAELRDMRRTLAQSWRGIFIGLFVFAALYVASSALQAFWKWVNS
jgi:hypothetical protein